MSAMYLKGRNFGPPCIRG